MEHETHTTVHVEHRSAETPEPSTNTAPNGTTLGAAIAHGAVAGLLGGVAMLLTSRAEEQVAGGTTETVTAGRQIVDVALQRRDAKLSPAQASAAGIGVQLAMCAAWGGLFGAVQHTLHPPSVLHALTLAGLSYVVLYPESGLLPRMGAAPPVTQQSMGSAAGPLGAHLAFGVATAAAFSAMERIV